MQLTQDYFCWSNSKCVAIIGETFESDHDCYTKDTTKIKHGVKSSYISKTAVKAIEALIGT